MKETIEISKLRLDGGTQPRAEISSEVVAEFAERMQAGDEFPAVVVFHDGTNHWLADGFHRVRAREQAGEKSIAADIRQGTQREAVLYSVGANAAHGVLRKNEDKRRAVMTLLNDEEWSQWSDGEISRRANVTRQYVTHLRPQPILATVASMDSGNAADSHAAADASTQNVTTRNFIHPKSGKKTTMKTGNINKGRSPRKGKRAPKEMKLIAPPAKPDLIRGSIHVVLDSFSALKTAHQLMDKFESKFLQEVIAELQGLLTK